MTGQGNVIIMNLTKTTEFFPSFELFVKDIVLDTLLGVTIRLHFYLVLQKTNLFKSTTTVYVSIINENCNVLYVISSSKLLIAWCCKTIAKTRLRC